MSTQTATTIPYLAAGRDGRRPIMTRLGLAIDGCEDLDGTWYFRETTDDGQPMRVPGSVLERLCRCAVQDYLGERAQLMHVRRCVSGEKIWFQWGDARGGEGLRRFETVDEAWADAAHTFLDCMGVAR
jgi:hypothetical protein